MKGALASFLAGLGTTTTTLKFASLATVTLGLFVATWSASADTSGLPYRYWNRYTGSLERKLRPMFVFTPGRRIALGQVLVGFAVVVAHVIFTIPFWWVAILLVAIGPTLHIEQQRKQRVEQIEAQLDSFMLALANALKATPSIAAAFGSVSTVVQEPMRSEIDLAVKEMKVGSSLEQALLHMASRVGSRQLDSALSSVLIGRQVGGNLPKVLEGAAGTLREMRRLEGVVKTKTAEGKFQLWVIALMPFAMLVGLNTLWPGYFDPLTKSLFGYMIIVAVTGCWVSALVLARKVLAVDL